MMRRLTILVVHDEPECGGAADAAVSQLVEELTGRQKEEGWEIVIDIESCPVLSSTADNGGENTGNDGGGTLCTESDKRMKVKGHFSHLSYISHALNSATNGVERDHFPLSTRHIIALRESDTSFESLRVAKPPFFIILVLLKDNNYVVHNAVRKTCAEPLYQTILLHHQTMTHLSNFDDVGLLLRFLSSWAQMNTWVQRHLESKHIVAISPKEFKSTQNGSFNAAAAGGIISMNPWYDGSVVFDWSALHARLTPADVRREKTDSAVPASSAKHLEHPEKNREGEDLSLYIRELDEYGHQQIVDFGEESCMMTVIEIDAPWELQPLEKEASSITTFSTRAIPALETIPTVASASSSTSSLPVQPALPSLQLYAFQRGPPGFRPVVQDVHCFLRSLVTQLREQKIRICNFLSSLVLFEGDFPTLLRHTAAVHKAVKSTGLSIHLARSSFSPCHVCRQRSSPVERKNEVAQVPPSGNAVTTGASSISQRLRHTTVTTTAATTGEGTNPSRNGDRDPQICWTSIRLRDMQQEEEVDTFCTDLFFQWLQDSYDWQCLPHVKLFPLSHLSSQQASFHGTSKDEKGQANDTKVKAEMNEEVEELSAGRRQIEWFSLFFHRIVYPALYTHLGFPALRENLEVEGEKAWMNQLAGKLKKKREWVGPQKWTTFDVRIVLCQLGAYQLFAERAGCLLERFNPMVSSSALRPCRAGTSHSDSNMSGAPPSSPLPLSFSSAPRLAVDLSSLSVGSFKMEIALSHAFAAAASYRPPTVSDSLLSPTGGEAGTGSTVLDSLVRIVIKVRKNGMNFSLRCSSSSKVDTSPAQECWSRRDTDALFRCVDRCQQRIYPPLDPLQYLENAPIFMADIPEEHAVIAGTAFSSPPSCLSSASFSRHGEGENCADAVPSHATSTVVVFFLRPTAAIGTLGACIGEMETEEGTKGLHSRCRTPWWPFRSFSAHPEAATAATPIAVSSVTSHGEETSPESPSSSPFHSPVLSRHVVDGSRPWFHVVEERRQYTVPLSSSLSSASACPTADASLCYTDEELWRLAKHANERYTNRSQTGLDRPFMEGEERQGGNASRSGKGSFHSGRPSSEGGSTDEARHESAEVEEEKWATQTERQLAVQKKIHPITESEHACVMERCSHRPSPTPRSGSSGGSRRDEKNETQREEEEEESSGKANVPHSMDFSASPLHVRHWKGRQDLVDAVAPPTTREGCAVSSGDRLLRRMPMDGVHDGCSPASLYAARRQRFLFRWRFARWLAERWVNEASWAVGEKGHALLPLSAGGGRKRERKGAGRTASSSSSLPSSLSRTSLGVAAEGAARDVSVLEAAFRHPSRRCRHCDGRGIECTLYWVGQTSRYAYLAVVSTEGNDITTVHALPSFSSVSPTTFAFSDDEGPKKMARLEHEARRENGRERKRVAVVVARVPIPWIQEKHEGGAMGDGTSAAAAAAAVLPSTRHTPHESAWTEGTGEYTPSTAESPIPDPSLVWPSDVVPILPAPLKEVLAHDPHFRPFPFFLWRVVTVRAHAVVAVVHDVSSLSTALPSSFSSSSSIANHSEPASFQRNHSSSQGKYALRCGLEDCFVMSIQPLSSSWMAFSKETAATRSLSSIPSPVAAEVHSFQDLLWLIHESCSRYLDSCARYVSLLTPLEKKRREKEKKGGINGVSPMKAHDDLVSSDVVRAEDAQSAMVELEKSRQTKKPNTVPSRTEMVPSVCHDGCVVDASNRSTIWPCTSPVRPCLQEVPQMEIVQHGLELFASMRDTYSVHFKKRRESRRHGPCTAESTLAGWQWAVQKNASVTPPQDGVGTMVEDTTASLCFSSLAEGPNDRAAVVLSPLPTRVPSIRTCRDVWGMMEGPTVEFKYALHDHRLPTPSTASVDRLRHTIAAMASTLGGIVCIGVRDEDGAVVGHAVGDVTKESGKRLVCRYCPAMVKDAVTLQELPVMYSTCAPIGTGEVTPCGRTLRTTASFSLPTRTMASPRVKGASGEEEATRKETHTPGSPLDRGTALAKDWWKTGRMLGVTEGPSSLSSPSPHRQRSTNDASPLTPSSSSSSSSVEERRMTLVRIQRGQAPFYCVAKDAIPYQRGCASTTPMSVWSMIHRIFEQLKE